MAKGQAFRQAYDPATMKRLERTPIPAKLKCCRCNKFKSHDSFSNKQITDVRFAVDARGQNAQYQIKCQPCVGNHVVELECSICGVTKGLEEFAKTQRKKFESAECFKCTDRRLDVNPILEDEYDQNNDRARPFLESDDRYIPTVFESSDASETTTNNEWDESDADEERGGVSLSQNFARQMTISNTKTPEKLIDDEYHGTTSGDLATDDASDSQGWQSVSHGSWRTPIGDNTQSPSSSGFNPNKYGRPGVSHNSSDTQRSFSSDRAEQQSEEGPVMRGKFAKIKAYKAPPKKELWDSDSEDGSPDDDDDDDDQDYFKPIAGGSDDSDGEESCI